MQGVAAGQAEAGGDLAQPLQRQVEADHAERRAVEALERDVVGHHPDAAGGVVEVGVRPPAPTVAQAAPVPVLRPVVELRGGEAAAPGRLALLGYVLGEGIGAAQRAGLERDQRTDHRRIAHHPRFEQARDLGPAQHAGLGRVAELRAGDAHLLEHAGEAGGDARGGVERGAVRLPQHDAVQRLVAPGQGQRQQREAAQQHAADQSDPQAVEV